MIQELDINQERLEKNYLDDDIVKNIKNDGDNYA